MMSRMRDRKRGGAAPSFRSPRRPPMKRCLSLALALTAGWLSAPACGQPASEVETAFVYKPDGTQHCETTRGISLDSMAQELIRSGISVYSQRKSYDGREGIALCGGPTGSINAYEIAVSDLLRASQSGFQRLDPSWFDPR